VGVPPILHACSPGDFPRCPTQVARRFASMHVRFTTRAAHIPRYSFPGTLQRHYSWKQDDDDFQSCMATSIHNDCRLCCCDTVSDGSAGCWMFAWRRDRPRHLVVRSLARADEIVVSVRDARIGIDPLHMKHLFNAFFTTKADGMGMGLSICRSIIGAHGGRIWASNNTGSGMTSQFALPLRLGDTS